METIAPIVIKDRHSIETEWKQNMHFASSVQGHTIHMDKLPQHGGEDTGPRPKPLLLSAISGCAGMELIAVLQKMRIHPKSLRIDVTGDLGDSHPKIYTDVYVKYVMEGDLSEKDRIEKAIKLVEEKYCGIVAMVKHFARFTSELEMHDINHVSG
jgi:putative redox protein